MKPPFTVTEEMLTLVADISERVGRISERATGDLRKSPMLRKANRIRTIQGSLAIEQNTLTIEQVTAVLNGKTVLAPPKDIAEVRNAYEIYERLDRLRPESERDLLAAHRGMMRDLVENAGAYREKPVGVVNQRNEIVHFGTLPQYVPEAVANLLEWLKTTQTHPLIKSAVFHYELELIHPFLDGNGRMGRLWHTLILSKWNPLFAWLPVESMIYRNQQKYYEAINHSNDAGNSTAFILFMLSVISDTLAEAEAQEQVGDQVEEQVGFDELLAFCREPRSRGEMQRFCRIDGRKQFTARYLRPLIDAGKLSMTIPEKPNSRLQKYVAKTEP